MDRKFFLFAWTLTIVIGWLVGTILVPIEKDGLIVEVLPVIFGLSLLQGVIVGASIGIGQWLLFNRTIPPKWLSSSLISYSLLKPLGLAVAVLIISISLWVRSGSSLLSDPTFFFASPSNMDAVFGGWVIGLGLWPVIRKHAQQGAKIALLWIIGSWASVGIGVFAGLFLRSLWGNLVAISSNIGRLIENFTVALVFGLGTAIILIIILGSPQKLFQDNLGPPAKE